MLTSKIFCGILFCMNTNILDEKKTIITQVKKVDAMHPDMSIIREAAEIIREGGLVGFPTETVYGLGADALLPEGAKRIYAAKGRPSDNPLIVHIADFEALDKITADIPPQAKALADAFWPGPLTMIFRKSDAVPYETTGGLDTVAVRRRDPYDPAAGVYVLFSRFFPDVPCLPHERSEDYPKAVPLPHKSFCKCQYIWQTQPDHGTACVRRSSG